MDKLYQKLQKSDFSILYAAYNMPDHWDAFFSIKSFPR